MENVKLRCASCGWTGLATTPEPGYELVKHLVVCPSRDESRFVPRWNGMYDGLECAWTTITSPPEWQPFTPEGLNLGGLGGRDAVR